ncbi:hypothetical protein T310_8178 [Rasamsonia emersonii CBS 393.64]|uniref:Uncharacterized protein n=1 Tax=Rasamsonia emersonii (strain ATCC 16479 / CBS 393.64 / IMI 116815) TaxID=1408163 RepID=A0A0F4YIC9_RASE3|nr:hypothetical protein T310_8178 [Rasamsonia emersonii CBS 393.64]KKA17875.1 hypothetical protein T310_8178 [Rasamsonia emersonii CBS 393.64]
MDASQVRSTPYTDNGGTNGGRGTWDRILRCYGTSVVQGPTPVDRSALAARKQPSLAVHPINDAKKLTKDLGRRRKLELQRSRDLGWQAAGQNVASPSMIVARIIRAPWGLRIASKDGPTRIKSFTTISFATLHFGFQRTLWTPIFSPVISRRATFPGRRPALTQETAMSAKTKVRDARPKGNPDHESPNRMPNPYTLANIGPATNMPTECMTDAAEYKVATWSEGTRDVATLRTDMPKGMPRDTNTTPRISTGGVSATKITRNPAMANAALAWAT